MPSQPNSHRRPTRIPGVRYRLRAKFPGSKQTERVYCVMYRDSAGKMHWTSEDANGNPLLSEDAAKDRKAELSKERRSGSLVRSSSKATFAEYADEWLPLQVELAPRTSEDYKLKLERVKRHIGDVKLSALNTEAIKRVIGELRKVYASNTTANTLVPLSCLLDDAVSAGILGHNPVASLRESGARKSRKSSRVIPVAENVKEQRILSPAEIDALLSAATSDRYHVLLATAIYSGLRQMELLGLTWGDVDFDGRVIRVRQQLSRTPGVGRVAYTKSKKGKRDVPLSDWLLSLLREHRASTIYKAETDYIFTTSTGKPLGWSNVDRYCLASAVASAKLRTPHPTFHDLRHTYASLLIASGVNVKRVSDALGHADPGFTLRVYAGLFNREESDAQIRDATSGSPVVARGSRNEEARQTGQLVHFPENPHSSDLPAAQSRSR